MVEKPMPFNKQIKGQTSLSYQKAKEEERAYGNALGAKRVQVDISSPKMNSPSSTEENAAANGNGFVTAKAKLVCFTLLTAIFLSFDVCTIQALGDAFHFLPLSR